MPKRISVKLKKLTICVCLLFSSFSMIFAQGVTAVPFLQFNPSPRLNGMAGAFTALPTTDPHGQYFNPAQLGNFGREQNFSIQFYTPQTKWLPQFNLSDLTFSSTALAFGYNFQNCESPLPISVGFGIINTKLNLGENVYTDDIGNVLGTFDSKEYYTAYSIGIGFDYYARLNLGYTYKKITSELSGVNVGSEPNSGHSKGSAYDIGLQITLPVISIIDKVQEGQITLFGIMKPTADLSFGYSILNIGDEINYIDRGQASPLPRTAQVGAAFSLGLDMTIKEVNFTAFKLDWSSEARDVLVGRDSTSWKHTSPPGNINFWDNVIKGNTDNSVVIYRGLRIQIFDFFEISGGSLFEDINYGTRDYTTSGYRFTTRGPMKYLNLHVDSKIISYIANHIEISYAHSSYKTKYEYNSLDGTEFNGVTISVFGF